MISQVRYLGQPSTWCRMAPLAEEDEIAVVGRVWRREEDLDRSTSTEPQVEPQTAPAWPRLAVAAQPARSAATACRSATMACRPGHAPGLGGGRFGSSRAPGGQDWPPRAPPVPGKIGLLPVHRLRGDLPGRLVSPHPRQWRSRVRRSRPGRHQHRSRRPGRQRSPKQGLPRRCCPGGRYRAPPGRYLRLRCPQPPRCDPRKYGPLGCARRAGCHPPPRSGPRPGFHPRPVRGPRLRRRPPVTCGPLARTG